MPVQVSIDGDTVSVTFPPGQSSPPVCIETSSPNTFVSFPPPSDSRPPITVRLDGKGVVVTFPDDPPITIQTGDQVIVEFLPVDQSSFHAANQSLFITVKDGTLNKVESGSEPIERVKAVLD